MPLSTRARPLLVGAALLLAVPLGAQGTDTAKVVRKRTAYEDLQMFSQVFNQIRVNHLDTVESHELLMAAIQGMVRRADPHSYVISSVRLMPEKQRALEDGKFVPVPIDWDFSYGAPRVVSVAPGTKAAALDILPGDELTLADGKAIVAESEFELDVTLAGEKNSTVKLVFERQRTDGTWARLEREVRRERSEDGPTAVPAVTTFPDGVGYVRITTFSNRKVGDDLHKALETVEKSDIKGLVLDLRDNGGGLVKEAARIAGEFLPRGSIVYSSWGRKQEFIDTGRVERSLWRGARNYPVVVLVNAGTASASELVAGALQDHDRAVIVGRPTFGKSLMMQGFPMTDGSTFVLVIGVVRTPCGRAVQREYHGLTQRDYYRRARADRDTTGRPSCKTDNGRTVYGGGGVVPDVMLAERAGAPAWLQRLGEDDLFGRWAAGYVSDATTKLAATLDAFDAALPPFTEALVVFRDFAAKAGRELPADSASVARVRRNLLVAVAAAKWGDAGRYRVSARLDPEVQAAIAALGRASEILAPKK